MNATMFLQEPIIESIIICFSLKERFVVCALVCKAWRRVVADQYRYPLTWRLIARRLQNWFWFRRTWQTQKSFHVARLIKPLYYSGVVCMINSVYVYFDGDTAVMPIEHVGLVYAFGCANSPFSKSQKNDTATSAELTDLFLPARGEAPNYLFFEHGKIRHVAEYLSWLPLGRTFAEYRIESAFEDVSNLKENHFSFKKFLSVGLDISLDTSLIYYPNNREHWTITSRSLVSPHVMRLDFYCYAFCELNMVFAYSDICGGALYFDWFLRHQTQVERYLEVTKRRNANPTRPTYQKMSEWIKDQVARRTE